MSWQKFPPLKTSSTSASENLLNLYLVRHGETDANRYRKVQGTQDIPLNETGLQQAKALAAAFRNIPLAAVYSSPLGRAYKTAQLIACEHDLQPEKSAAFSELDHGLFEGLHDDELVERYPDELKSWINSPATAVMPEGESLGDVLKRALAAITRIRKRHQEAKQTVLVVAHEALNKVLLCHFLGWGLERFWSLKQDNASVNFIRIFPDFIQVSLINDTCHLKSNL